MRLNKPLRTAAALAAVTALLAACSDAESSDNDTDDASSTRSTPTEESPTPTEQGSPPTGDGSAPGKKPRLPQGVAALPPPDDGQTFATLAAGRYRIPLSDSLAFDVDLPQDSYAHEDGLFVASREIILKVEIAGEEYGVPSDICSSPDDLAPAGPTTADLVDAITGQPAYRTSRPERVTIDGAEGQHLTVRIRPGDAAENCPSDQVVLPGDPDTNVELDVPYLGEWTILDVDGQRVVVHQLCGECEADATDRMATTLQSITFTPTP